MKRCVKIILGLSLMLALWLWSYSQLELSSWLTIPIIVAALLAVYAANDILGSIIRIKSYPEERLSLDLEIKAAS
jgi:hypothetical protein